MVLQSDGSVGTVRKGGDVTEDEKLYADLSERIRLLDMQRSAVHKRILTTRSPFQVGDVIGWGNRRGRVRGISERCGGQLKWGVINIRKDGTEGATAIVRDYDKPVLIERAAT